tara:strand:- start:304 stop:510 length:207 start_codon:yes stop_codon:yes gene_type:complete
MKFFIVLPISLCFLFSTKIQASRIYKLTSVCERFAAGKIDALTTLKALDLNIEDYSIGLNNTAKVFCK